MNQAVFRQAVTWQIGVVFSRRLAGFGQFRLYDQPVNAEICLATGTRPHETSNQAREAAMVKRFEEPSAAAANECHASVTRKSNRMRGGPQLGVQLSKQDSWPSSSRLEEQQFQL